MNPLLQWIERHRRGEITPAEIRRRYEEIYGAQNPRDWQVAFGQAAARERTRAALTGYSEQATVGFALAGVLAGRGDVTVPMLVVGTDVGGHRMARVVYVTIGRADRITDLYELARQAAQQDDYARSISIDSINIMPGTYQA